MSHLPADGCTPVVVAAVAVDTVVAAAVALVKQSHWNIG